MNKYQRQVPSTTIDIYDVLNAYRVTCPATQHAIKKLLQPGERGHKDKLTDLREALASVERAIQMAEITMQRRIDKEPGLEIAFEFNLVSHLERQISFSKKAFGPNHRTSGVVDHLRKELCEVENNPDDIFEWIDVVLLALDGAWRRGFSPEEICKALTAKLLKNEQREWPDWRYVPEDKAIEHVVGGD